MAARAPAGSATVVGRYYAMDRDNRWDRSSARTTRSFTGAPSTRAATRRRGGRARPTQRDETDEFIKPVRRRRLGGPDPPRRLGVRLQLPARPVREITRALARAPTSTEIDRGGARRSPGATRCMTEYDERFGRYPVAFPTRAPVGDDRRP